MADDQDSASARGPDGRFKPGKEGGPGRPKGSRNKLGEAFLSDMFESWSEHGAAAIEAMRTEDPVAYVRVVASLLPRDVRLTADPFADWTDEQLDARISELMGSASIARH